MAQKIKRTEFKTFLNTTPDATATWSLIGDGVTSAQIDYNPEVSDETYIHQDTGTKEVEKYSPSMSIEASAKSGDATFEFIDGLRKARAVLEDARTQILNVWLYETPTAGDQYPCEKQEVSVQVDSFGGEGGVATKINYTINYVGNPVLGLYDVSTGVFAPAV